jgi:hypothetical protein
MSTDAEKLYSFWQLRTTNLSAQQVWTLDPSSSVKHKSKARFVFWNSPISRVQKSIWVI